jgi:hypothetical protein
MWELRSESQAASKLAGDAFGQGGTQGGCLVLRSALALMASECEAMAP